MTSLQVECVINKNKTKLLRNLIVGIYGDELLVSRQNLFLYTEQKKKGIILVM